MELDEEPDWEQVQSQIFDVMSRNQPFRLYAKGKFMEQTLMQFYVHEFEETFNPDLLHSKARLNNFDCHFHKYLVQDKNYKYHCALDDAVLLAKIATRDQEVIREMKGDIREAENAIPICSSGSQSYSDLLLSV